jgi:ABC-type oligopeptide transport system ATPase subunit
MSTTEARPLLQTLGLSKHYAVRRGSFARDLVKAVDGVDLRILAGESFGIVGESGSGKSTVAKLILRLTRPPPAR